MCVCVCGFRICWKLTLEFCRYCDVQRVGSEDHSSLQTLCRHVKQREETTLVCVGREREEELDPGQRQINWEEDNFEIRKTLHDEEKDIGELVRQEKIRSEGKAGKKKTFRASLKWNVFCPGGLSNTIVFHTVLCLPSLPLLRFDAAKNSSRVESRAGKIHQGLLKTLVS